MKVKENFMARLALILFVVVSSKCFAASISGQNTAAINSAISSIDPSRAGQNLQQSSLPKPSAAYHQENKSIKPQEEIKGADKIKFHLTQIQIEGNTVFTEKALSPIYSAYLNKTVTLGDIQKIVREITLKYRGAGYVLSRAVLPAQVIKKGIVKIQVIEGYIESAAVQGSAGNSRKILTAYGSRLSSPYYRPLNINDLERYALLANDIPGMQQASTVLEPPADKNAPQGSTHLVFTPYFSRFTGYVGVDNRITKYLGQSEVSAGGSVNSLIQSGDQESVQALTSNHPRRLKFFSLHSRQPLGATGSVFVLSGSISRTAPEFLLKPLDIKGKSGEVVASVQTPWIRSRKQSLYSIASLDYLNSKTDINLFHTNLYDDRIRSGRLEVDYSRMDSFKGLNQFGAQFSHGLSIWNSNSGNEQNLSRVKGDPKYTKWNLSLSRQQGITESTSLYVAGMGQYTHQPLLSAEQFTLGGGDYGQAYDPGEISGDKGIAGKAEFRLNSPLNWSYLKDLQYFAFYDIGKVENIEPQSVNGLAQQQSAASTGVGVRVNFNAYLSGEGEVAKPLTRDVATLNNRSPRFFLSLSLSGKAKPVSDNPIESPSLIGGAASNGPQAKYGVKVKQIGPSNAEG